ncbi:MAG: hypothetical protein ABIC91_08280 [Nanoarchaeota archaeon]|nr:hypothetical protein [Nanoarchaeota archaeon]MBU1031082.1 hypothetical protein [Nanoarchaeota archaeon]
MYENIKIDEYIDEILKNNNEIIIVDKIVSDENCSQFSLGEYMFKRTQYILAPNKPLDSVDALQKLMISLILKPKVYASNDFFEQDSMIYCGTTYFKQKIGDFQYKKGLILKNKLFSNLIKPEERFKDYEGKLLQEVSISLFPSEIIAKKMIRRELAKDYWDEEFINPHEKFIPGHLPVKKELIQKL